jgi:hypothetical protein
MPKSRGPSKATTRTPTGKIGRPSALTPETKNRFLAALAGLNTVEDASVYAGIGVSTVSRWLAEGRKQARGELRDFWVAVEDAKARAKMSLVQTVVTRGRQDPAMALKLLERRYPGEWSRTHKLEVEDTTPANKFTTSIRDQIAAQLDQIEQRLAVTPKPIDLGADVKVHTLNGSANGRTNGNGTGPL